MSHEQLFRTAREALERNLVFLPSGKGLTAGQGQFEALWTRDFCFAVPGLLGLGYADVVRDHLSRLLMLRRRSDDLIPRLVDSVSPAWLRVLHFTAGKVLRGRLARLPLRDPLKPEFRNEHGVASIDSNLLTLWAALRYVDVSGDLAWWRRWEEALVGVFRYYDPRLEGGLVTQPSYADWQDSVCRKGKILYTNLLYFSVSRELARRPAFGVTAEEVVQLRRRVLDSFFDERQRLFRSLESGPQISLDGNLLALEWEFFDDDANGRSDSSRLYAALRNHALWPSPPAVPGFATHPNYPDQSIALQVKLVGLRRYHDELYWSWLMALAAKVARKFGEEAETVRIFDRLESMVRRDGVVHEVYEPRLPYRPWKSWLYASESSFSWGAGMIIDALQS